jgi:hypothetical protein
MWRFLLAATGLVAAFVFAITLRKLQPPDIRVSARASGTPSPARSQLAGGATPGPLYGEAPWALSALPDCARQHDEYRGNAEHVRAKIPAGAIEVTGHIIAGPCTIDVTSNGILVQRGSDRLRIPPPARLLYSGDRYYLYNTERKAAVLRVYSFTQ